MQRPMEGDETRWLGQQQRETLAALEAAVLDGGGLLVLTGELGVGKSTMVSALVARLGARARVAKLPYPRVDAREVFEALGLAFGFDVRDGERPTFLAGLARMLEDAGRDGTAVLVVVDEAHELAPETLGELAQLPSAVNRADAARLSMLLVGPDELQQALADHPADLRRLVTLSPTIAPLTAEETQQYVRHSVARLGADAPSFSLDALRAIAEISRGLPRVIETLCDSFVPGGVREHGSVDALAVRERAERLGLLAPPSIRPVDDPVGAIAGPSGITELPGASATERPRGRRAQQSHQRARRRYAVAVAIGLAGGAIVLALASTGGQDGGARSRNATVRASEPVRAGGPPAALPSAHPPSSPAPQPAALAGPAATVPSMHRPATETTGGAVARGPATTDGRAEPDRSVAGDRPAAVQQPAPADRPAGADGSTAADRAGAADRPAAANGATAADRPALADRPPVADRPPAADGPAPAEVRPETRQPQPASVDAPASQRKASEPRVTGKPPSSSGRAAEPTPSERRLAATPHRPAEPASRPTSRVPIPATSPGGPPARRDAPDPTPPSSLAGVSSDAAGGHDPGAIIDWLLRDRR